jgi:hypothetical protein
MGSPLGTENIPHCVLARSPMWFRAQLYAGLHAYAAAAWAATNCTAASAHAAPPTATALCGTSHVPPPALERKKVALPAVVTGVVACLSSLTRTALTVDAGGVYRMEYSVRRCESTSVM